MTINTGFAPHVNVAILASAATTAIATIASVGSASAAGEDDGGVSGDVLKPRGRGGGVRARENSDCAVAVPAVVVVTPSRAETGRLERDEVVVPPIFFIIFFTNSFFYYPLLFL